ncbi:hypothetical protein Tco_0880389 [Tanacetum coccineum]
MWIKTELTLEQTQQGVSDEVLISIEGSDTKVFTMTMEILPEPTSNKLYGSDEVLKLKNFKKDGYSSFQDKEKYEHVDPKVTSSQEGKRSQDDDKRLDLTDDLKEAQYHIQVKLKETSSSLKSKISLHISQDDDKDTRHRAASLSNHAMTRQTQITPLAITTATSSQKPPPSTTRTHLKK